MMELRSSIWAMLMALATWGMTGGTGHAAKDVQTTSGLPVPRYVSLKSDHVNVRVGPTKDQDVSWIYTRAGLPVEVTMRVKVGSGPSTSAARKTLVSGESRKTTCVIPLTPTYSSSFTAGTRAPLSVSDIGRSS